MFFSPDIFVILFIVNYDFKIKNIFIVCIKNNIILSNKKENWKFYFLNYFFLKTENKHIFMKGILVNLFCLHYFIGVCVVLPMLWFNTITNGINIVVNSDRKKRFEQITERSSKFC